jgi:cytochrome c oxidase cbb3-type subunit 1
MSPTATVQDAPAATPTRDPAEIRRETLERAEIDASTRFPVLLFFTAALFWLLVSNVLSLITSLQLHYPVFLAEFSWFTYGRLAPIQRNLMIYGWASLAGIGTSIWLMARLSRVKVKYPFMISVGAYLWNIGLVVGSLAIMAGDQNPERYLEYPAYAAWMIFLGYAAIGIWGVVLFHHRRPGVTFVTHWYLLCAFFAFPWIYATANLMLHVLPVDGVMQAVVLWWYGGNLIGLWITAIGLGAAYYFIPKVIGRPIHSYHLASFGFWTFVLFYSWRGLQELVGGPVPIWVPTVSIVACGLTIIPVVTVAMNHHMTMRGSFGLMHYSPTLRFVVIGAMAYTVSQVFAIVMSFRSFDRIFAFTIAEEGLTWFQIYPFFSLIMFGAMYYIVPRLVGCEWRSAWLIKAHFWGVAYGMGLALLMLFAGGIMQGTAFNDPVVGYDEVVSSALPFLRGLTLAQSFLLVGHTIFALHFLIMLFRLGAPIGSPTLMAEEGEVAKGH